jgi:hypothetical protein
MNTTLEDDEYDEERKARLIGTPLLTRLGKKNEIK